MKKHREEGINRFNNTISQQNKFKHKIQDLPKSKYYRKELEPLLGAVVSLECDSWKIHLDVVDGEPCCRLLLLSAKVKKFPKNRNITDTILISHIWTLLDPGWKNRVELEDNDTLEMKGFIYIYKNHGFKNIGFQCLTARPKRE